MSIPFHFRELESMEHYPLRPYRRLYVDKLPRGFSHGFIDGLCPTWSGDGLLVLLHLFTGGVSIYHLSRLDSLPEPIHFPLIDKCEHARNMAQACPRLQDYLLCVGTSVCRFTLSGTVLWSTSFDYQSKAAVWTACNTVLVSLGTRSICILDGVSGTKLNTVNIPFQALHIALDPTGALYGKDQQTRTIWKIHNIHEEDLCACIPHVGRAPYYGFCFDSSGHILSPTGPNSSVSVTDARGRNVFIHMPYFTSAVACLSDGRVVVACWSHLYVL